MNLHWYPGHMAKTKRLILENLKIVDIVIEIVDARLPRSSKNPIMDDLLKNKPRLIVINKSDLADSKINELWVKWFAQKGIPAILVSSALGSGMNKLYEAVSDILREKLQRDKDKGMKRSIRMMIVGIPNAGKSTFINRLSGRAATITADRPGVTKGKQWISVKSGFELLDTPGILWPKFEDKKVALKLAFTGAIRDDIIDTEELAIRLLSYLKEHYPDMLTNRYKVIPADFDVYELLNEIGRKRGCIVSGGEIDTKRISAILLDEFRGAKIGNISLEQPFRNEEINDGSL